MVRVSSLLLALGCGLAAVGWQAPAAAWPIWGAELAQRPVSDQDRARRGRETGELLPLETLFQRAQRIGQGEYVGVEPDMARQVYRFKFMRADGRVTWVDIDGRSGRVLGTQ